MKNICIAAFIIAVCTISIGVNDASAGTWVPGTNYYVSEDDANDFIDDVFDTAYCSGINRFGHRGEFPYEEFVVFDCSLSRDDYYCTGVRFKAVKGAHRGYYKMKVLRNGHCY